MSTTKLWYRQPAAEYMAGLPIGTGRLAAMVIGSLAPDRVALNHEWLWRGEHRSRDIEPRSHLLPEVRQLLLAGQYEEGTRKGNEAFSGPGGSSGQPNRVDPYQPAGDLHFQLDHGPASAYHRELDLDTGVVSVSYRADGVRFRRQYLADLQHDLILVHLEADQPFSGRFWLARREDPGCLLRFETSADRLVMDGQFERGIGFRVEARLNLEGGTVATEGEQVVVSQARRGLVAVDIGTSAQCQAPARECSRHRLTHTDWPRLRRQSQKVYRKLYGGLRLELDIPPVKQSTDQRLQRARAGASDPGLPALYFNYGRYLLVATTATAELPPNLQGKWNEDLRPPWEADYHHDVNLQMNYWPAESGHLQYSTEALFQHLERFVPHARKAAQDLYGCRGVWFPIQTDPWGRSTPESFGWAVWIGAAAWLAQHLWWHYEYGRDPEFLRQRAYPFLKEVAAFYESYLIEDGHGLLQVVPSQSPENRIAGGGDLPVTLCVSATMDLQLIQDLLGHAIQAAQRLGMDPDKQQEWRSILDRLPPIGVGRHGQLQEWSQDFEEVEPGHRHYSHLFGLYPGDSIDPERSPELWQAARASLERRLAHAGGHTGWSRSWTACFYARLGQAEPAWEHLVHLILDFATDSLLDLHPPRIFQIDGNFGGTAAVLEMLLQSYHEELHFLPALPQHWPQGRCQGLRARGGYTVDLSWQASRLQRVEIVSLEDRECTVRHAVGRLQVVGEAGEPVPARQDGHRLCFGVRAGHRYVLVPGAWGGALDPVELAAP